MIDRRTLLTTGAAALLAGCAEAPVGEGEQIVVTSVTSPDGASRPVRIPQSFLPTAVPFQADLPPGAIYVDVGNTWLYLVQSPGTARRYKIAVGAAGENFRGGATVQRKAEWPGWRPTASMIRKEPEVYAQAANGLPGGHPRNPLGARALYLYQNGVDTMYRIHGTPQPWTMGMSFSSGCIRMINEHMIDLYARVPLGTPVVVS